jgi:tRNA(fMet)-specific endonuclease VapC
MSVQYLLDTNICIYVAKHRPSSVREHFVRHAANEMAMSVITLGELRFGAEKSQSRDKAMATIQDLETMIPPRALPEAAGEHYGQIRAGLEKAGTPIGNSRVGTRRASLDADHRGKVWKPFEGFHEDDLWLAAHARAEGWILVTNNTREFARVPGLQVENWAEVATT